MVWAAVVPWHNGSKLPRPRHIGGHGCSAHSARSRNSVSSPHRTHRETELTQNFQNGSETIRDSERLRGSGTPVTLCAFLGAVFGDLYSSCSTCCVPAASHGSKRPIPTSCGKVRKVRYCCATLRLILKHAFVVWPERVQHSPFCAFTVYGLGSTSCFRVSPIFGLTPATLQDFGSLLLQLLVVIDVAVTSQLSTAFSLGNEDSYMHRHVKTQKSEAFKNFRGFQ